jgi:hypothetical protein
VIAIAARKDSLGSGGYSLALCFQRKFSGIDIIQIFGCALRDDFEVIVQVVLQGIIGIGGKFFQAAQGIRFSNMNQLRQDVFLHLEVEVPGIGRVQLLADRHFQSNGLKRVFHRADRRFVVFGFAGVGEVDYDQPATDWDDHQPGPPTALLESITKTDTTQHPTNEPKQKAK